jgi:preprotein translocase subunit SecF
MGRWSSPKISFSPKASFNLHRFKKMRWGVLSISSISIALFVVMGVLYVTSINIVSTKGAKLHTLEMEKQTVTAENERLALEAARLESLAVIEGGAQEKIEIGEDGKPTGRVLEPPTNTTIPSTDATQPEKVTYIPKMVQMNGLTFVEDTGPLAQR